MKSKADIISTIESHKHYAGSFVIARINEVQCGDKCSPTQIRKGDVLVVNSGVKSRPAVVIKVLTDKVIVIPLTSTENVHNLCPSESRFFKSGWFCNLYDVVSMEEAKNRFVGVYDNPKLLNTAIKELKKFIDINI